MIKTFRGLLADGGQDRIRLGTIKGKVGYKITKFEVIGTAPGSASYETVLKIYKTNQTSIDAVINFTDSNLLAAAAYAHSSSGDLGLIANVIIFDSEIFNQDIFITHKATGSSNDMNYYLELEVISLTDMGAEYSTLKDIRTHVTAGI